MDNWEIEKRIWNTRGLKTTERLVALALVQFRNNQTGLCFPSHKKVAERVDLSRNAVRGAIRGLRHKGVLHARFNGYHSNQYLFFDSVVNNKNTGVENSTPPYQDTDPLKEMPWDHVYSPYSTEAEEKYKHYA